MRHQPSLGERFRSAIKHMLILAVPVAFVTLVVMALKSCANIGTTNLTVGCPTLNNDLYKNIVAATALLGFIWGFFNPTRIHE